MSALVTAAEAQALLDAAPAGPYEALHPDDLPGRSIVRGGREVRPPYDAFVVGIEDSPRVALAELFAASPDLARTVIAQAAENATLRARAEAAELALAFVVAAAREHRAAEAAYDAKERERDIANTAFDRARACGASCEEEREAQTAARKALAAARRRASEASIALAALLGGAR